MGAVPIAKALEFNNTLTVLAFKVRTWPKGRVATENTHFSIKCQFQGGMIGEEGACALADAIKINQSLTTLDLEVSKIE